MIRSKAFFTKAENLAALGGKYTSAFLGFGGKPRARLRARFLRWHCSTVRASRRSITRGLGLSASVMTLRLAGMWEREKFYLSLDHEEPLPAAPTDILWDSVPEGWDRFRTSFLDRRFRKLVRDAQDVFMQLLLQKTWTPQFVEGTKEKHDTYWCRVRERSFNFSRASCPTQGKGRQLYYNWFSKKPTDLVPWPFRCGWIVEPEVRSCRSSVYLWVPRRERVDWVRAS